MIGVEYAVCPLGAPEVISDGAVSDQDGIGPESHGLIAVSGQSGQECVVGIGSYAVGVQPYAGTVYPDAGYAEFLFEQFGGFEPQGE